MYTEGKGSVRVGGKARGGAHGSNAVRTWAVRRWGASPAKVEGAWGCVRAHGRGAGRARRAALRARPAGLCMARDETTGPGAADHAGAAGAAERREGHRRQRRLRPARLAGEPRRAAAALGGRRAHDDRGARALAAEAEAEAQQLRGRPAGRVAAATAVVAGGPELVLRLRPAAAVAALVAGAAAAAAAAAGARPVAAAVEPAVRDAAEREALGLAVVVPHHVLAAGEAEASDGAWGGRERYWCWLVSVEVTRHGQACVLSVGKPALAVAHAHNTARATERSAHAARAQ
ncbi:MAG: hypothetical protein J3K34DRAFT_73378 [Monoraphidium minutum]|nr:MAG: hypothetical protein J3K34DRAFT_73378 [Monoraphidium minutum]